MFSHCRPSQSKLLPSCTARLLPFPPRTTVRDGRAVLRPPSAAYLRWTIPIGASCYSARPPRIAGKLPPPSQPPPSSRLRTPPSRKCSSPQTKTKSTTSAALLARCDKCVITHEFHLPDESVFFPESRGLTCLSSERANGRTNDVILVLIRKVAIHISNEVRDQNSMLDGMGGAFENTGDSIRHTISHIRRLASSGGGLHICILFVFAFVFFVLVYLLLR